MKKQVIFTVVFLYIILLAIASDTGNNYPTALGTGTWTDANAMFVSDDLSAEQLSSAKQEFTTFAISGTSLYNSIPTGATPNGITVCFEGYMLCDVCINGDKVDLLTAITNNSGTTYSTAKTLSVTSIGVDEVVCVGGTTDLWGLKWNKESFNNSNFKVRFNMSSFVGGNEILYGDSMYVSVDYTLASSDPCTYSGGSWVLPCNCNITGKHYIGNGSNPKLIVNGTGRINIIGSNVTNFSSFEPNNTRGQCTIAVLASQNHSFFGITRKGFG